MDSIKEYSRKDFDGLTDHELLSVLKELWVNPSSSKISVWGKLHKSKRTDGKYSYALREPKSTIYDEDIEYPIKGVRRPVSSYGIHVYIGKKELFKGNDFPVFIRCNLVLSRTEERERHNNPLDVCVDIESIEPLIEITKLSKNEINDSEFGSYLSKSVYSHYLKVNEKAIEAEARKLEKAFQDEHGKLVSSLTLKEVAASEALLVAENEKIRLQDEITRKQGSIDEMLSNQKSISRVLESLSLEKDGLESDISSLLNEMQKIEGDTVTVENSLGGSWAISKDLLVRDAWSAELYAQEVKTTMTELARILSE